MATSPPPLRLLLVGATGAVGSAVLELALADARFAAVTTLTRRPLAHPSPKHTNVVADLAQLPPLSPAWQADAVICALGTTRRKAGSEAVFVAIDRDLPVHIAHLARNAGATRFALTSSLGADAGSGNLYLRTKGETEQRIGAIGYPSLTIVRPSLIDAERSERRPAEQASMVLARLLRPLIPRRYRLVTPGAVAAALIGGVLAPPVLRRVIESGELGTANAKY
jgi:uncharacterized protein YbjT (DUF2867 family)